MMGSCSQGKKSMVVTKSKEYLEKVHNSQPHKKDSATLGGFDFHCVVDLFLVPCSLLLLLVSSSRLSMRFLWLIYFHCLLSQLALEWSFLMFRVLGPEMTMHWLPFLPLSVFLFPHQCFSIAPNWPCTDLTMVSSLGSVCTADCSMECKCQ